MPKPVQASTYTFRDIIENGFLYIDKTRYLYELVRYGKGVYFLARPRRFGKSLMVSTLEEIFLGHRALFRDLWIDSADYDWQSYPIVRFDFSANAVKSAANLEQVIDYYVGEIALQYGITLRGFDYQSRFGNLIEQLATTNGKVVLLIDEYDKPLIDNLTPLSRAVEIRDTLKNFYTIIKAMDRHLRFVFITGISKFSKVGVFSAMNNLNDLTMSPQFATALGITEEELTHYFPEYLAAFARKEGTPTEALTSKVREWYDGFCFVEGCENVYNPYSTLQLFYHQRFANYWFETGTPTFLFQLIKDRNYDIQPLDHLEVPALSFSTYAIERLELTPLLFQTGYLTIKDFHRDKFGELYTLSYPNYEVKHSFLTFLLSAYDEMEVALSDSHLRRLLSALDNQDLPRFFDVLAVFFANIDYALYIDREQYYQTIFYLIFKLIGLRIQAEVHTNAGRIDAVVELNNHIFLFEFKLNGSATDALAQIKEKKYYQQYLRADKTITCIGANFDTATRTVNAWESEGFTQ